MRQLKISQSITLRDAASLEKYLQEIAHLPMVSTEEEVSLARSIRAGDDAALLRLTQANLRFVVSVAKKYQFHGIALADLINEGNIGLIKAAHRFDETRGFKFISYAVWWIRQSIIQAIQAQGRLVHLPANKSALSLRMQRASVAMEQDLERPPTEEELSGYLNVGLEEVRITSGLHPFHASLDAPLSEGSDETLMDSMSGLASGADEEVLRQSLSTELNRTLSLLLTPAERDILCGLFGIGRQEAESLQETGARHGLGAERTRQIRDRALGKIRKSGKTDLLRTYL